MNKIQSSVTERKKNLNYDVSKRIQTRAAELPADLQFGLNVSEDAARSGLFQYIQVTSK